MSMTCNLRQVSDAQITELMKDRTAACEFLFGPIRQPRGLLQMLLGKRPPEPKPWVPPQPDEELCLDKAWHGIHYLLTGTDWEGEEPLCYIVREGESIAGTDSGYGEARALSAEQVKAFVRAMSALPPAEIERRYDPQKMMEMQIYPTIWKNDEADDPKGYVLEYLAQLREFLNQTAARGLGLVVHLS